GGGGKFRACGGTRPASAIACGRCVRAASPPHSTGSTGSTSRSYRRPSADDMRRLNLAGHMPLLSLIVLCAVTALLTDRFLSPLNLTNILVQSSIMAVVAPGLTFLIIGGGFRLSVRPTAGLPRCVPAMGSLV